jgi:hypothetical protein
MGLIGRHEDQLSLSHAVRFPRNGDFHLAFQNLHQCVKRRGVLAQPFVHIKGKEGYFPGSFFQNFAAYN